jgi:regulator of cell morphogenesis and NO signaling
MFTSSNNPRTITSYNRNIEHLFYRYEIPKNSTDSLDEIAINNELNSAFIIDLIKCYDDYDNINTINFNHYRIPVLVDYLEKSHKYYINKRLPEIEQCLDKLIKQESNPLTFLILSFFEEYKLDLISHFEKEDKLIFPYCKSLFNYYYFKSNDDLNFILKNGKKAIAFIDDHQQSKNELKKLQDILIKYKAPVKNLSFFQIFIQQLGLFQKDLKIHAEIEDNILEKKVKAINNDLDIHYA